MTADETETFQHYRVLRREDGRLWELGRGAMGVTYKAIDTNLHAPVALKIVNSQLLDRENARERFVREARAAASLRHRNVASVYHLGQDETSYFYAMEFIDGETVEQLVGRTGPQPWDAALRIARQITRALMAAHERNLVHRDIKPDNVMLVPEAGEREPVVKVIDFGLAKSLADDSVAGGAANRTTGFFGTPSYASPELCDETAPDIRSDLYSLGATLWYLLTGQPPFRGKLHEVLSKQLHDPPPWSLLPDETPLCVRALLERLLAKDRAKRPQTPAEVHEQIEDCLATAGVVSHPVPAPIGPVPISALAPAPSLVPERRPKLPEPPTLSRMRLDNCLRESGGRFPPALVAHLLSPLASVVDGAGSARLDLTPSAIWAVAHPRGTGMPHNAPFTDHWLTEGRPGRLEVAVQGFGDSAAADMTVVPTRTAVLGPAPALAALAYELLDGAPPPADRAYRPIAVCDEHANDVLRRALAGDPAEFPRAAAFAHALEEALGAAALQRGTTSPRLTPPVPVRAVIAISRGGRGGWKLAAAGMGALGVVLLAAALSRCGRNRRPFPPQAVVFQSSRSTPAPRPNPAATVAPEPIIASTPAPLPSPTAAPEPTPLASPAPVPVPVAESPSPAPLQAILDLARLHTVNGHWREAIDACTQALALKPDSIEALDERGTAYAALREDDKAKADFTAATQLQPADAHESFHRGDAYGSLGEMNKATPEYRKALAIDVHNAGDLWMRGRAYFHLKQFQEAANDFTGVIATNPQNAIACDARGLAFFNLKKYDQAITDLSQAVRLDPQNATVLYDRGYVYTQLHKWDQAARDLDESIRLDPDNRNAYLLRAEANKALGRQSESAADRESALRLKSRQ